MKNFLMFGWSIIKPTVSLVGSAFLFIILLGLFINTCSFEAQAGRRPGIIETAKQLPDICTGARFGVGWLHGSGNLLFAEVPVGVCLDHVPDDFGKVMRNCCIFEDRGICSVQAEHVDRSPDCDQGFVGFNTVRAELLTIPITFQE